MALPWAGADTRRMMASARFALDLPRAYPVDAVLEFYGRRAIPGVEAVDARGMGQPQIDDQQIDVGEVGAHAGEQFGGALHRDGAMPGALERALEAVSDKRGVVGNEDGFCARGAGGHERGRTLT